MTIEQSVRNHIPNKVTKLDNDNSEQLNSNQLEIDNEPVRDRRAKQMKLIMKQLREEDFTFMTLSEVIGPLLEGNQAESFKP